MINSPEKPSKIAQLKARFETGQASNSSDSRFQNHDEEADAQLCLGLLTNKRENGHARTKAEMDLLIQQSKADQDRALLMFSQRKQEEEASLVRIAQLEKPKSDTVSQPENVEMDEATRALIAQFMAEDEQVRQRFNI